MQRQKVGDDPRRGMPSASGMERLILCPGSWQLSQKCESLPETQAQKDGTRLHKAMEEHNFSKLYDPEEMAACEWCCNTTVRLAWQVFPNDIPSCWHEDREKRLWNAEQTYSGQPDLVVFSHVHRNRALVIDYKFGRGEVAEVQDNAQLMALAVLVADNYPQVEEVYCAILQPFASRQVPPTVCYTREDLEQARLQIKLAVSLATEKSFQEPPLVPGAKQCQYCPAKTICPEMVRGMAQVACTPQNADWSLLDPEEKAKRVALAMAVIPAATDVLDRARAELQEGKLIPGYELTKGRKVFKVTDAQKAYCELSDAIHVTGYEFAECCTVSMGKLDELARKLWQSMDGTEDMTVADCRKRVRELLEEAGAGEWVQQAGSIREQRKEIQG